MKNIILFLIAIGLSFVSNHCVAQAVELILNIDLVTDEEPVTYTDAIYDVELNLEEMRELPEQIQVRLLNDGIITVDRTDFAARAGYIYNDPPLPPFTVSPDAEIADMEYRWVGSSDDRTNEVSLNVFGTIVLASIWSGGKKYIIESGPEDGSHRMFEANGCIFCPPAPVKVPTLNPITLLGLLFIILLLVYRHTDVKN